ncbi:HlyD family secretion protein [Neoroseomonas eburnea]|uniref:HlyD family secretion protein n=1 Tax=Neoroseomonas eburnea TaxID=1346889 RepID=UPI001FE5FB8E|nr:HlyD family efflux transporter periplasmic adaptor subunit [Neoroseomonas eburnea]
MRRAVRPALLLALVLLGCDGKRADEFQGYVDAEYLRIAAPEAGWITGIAVAKGARVAAGAPLFTLDATRETAAAEEARASLAQARSELADREKGSRPEEIAAIEAQLAEAEATLVLARLTLERQEALARAQVAAVARLDEARAAAEQAQARRDRIRAELAVARLPAREDRVATARAAVEMAEAALAQAEWRLAQRSVASPAAGLIDDVLRRPGEWVPASGIVISLLPPDATKVVFFVPEARRATLHQGDRVALACTGCPDGLIARISRIASEAEYTPPVIYSRETRAKLVWRMEAVIDAVPGAPTPGQPVTVRAAP